MSYLYIKLLLTLNLNKMKRIIVIIIVLILAVAFTSCESRSGMKARLEERQEMERERLEVKNPEQLVRIQRIQRLATGGRLDLMEVDKHHYIILGSDNVIIHSEGCPCRK